MRRALIALAAAIALSGGPAGPQEDGDLPVTADAAAYPAKALDAWDHRAAGAFMNTIPFEKAVLRAAAEAKPVGADAAVAAVRAALRPKAAEMQERRLVSVAFDRVRTIAYTLGDAAGSATVDAAGEVTLR